MVNSFIMPTKDAIFIGSGILPDWLEHGKKPVALGPAATAWGPVTVRVRGGGERAFVEWDGDWRDQPPRIELRLPGFVPLCAEAAANCATIERTA